MMPPPLPKPKASRQPEAPSKRAVPQLRSQRMEVSGENSMQSHREYADSQDRGPRALQQTPASHPLQVVPRSRERYSRYTHISTVPDARQEPLYSAERQSSPSLPAVQLYGRTGWQDMPPPSATLEMPHRQPVSNRTEQIQLPYKQNGLPHRSLQSLLGTERPVLSTGFNQLSSRVPLTQAVRRDQAEPHPSSQMPIYEPGDWRGATPRSRMDIDYEPQASRLQPLQPYLDASQYRRPRRSNVGHNGTTTLSSEFRAQERSTNSQRQVGQPSLPANSSISRYREDRPHAASEVSYYDPIYGTLEQQSGNDAPREMESFYMPPSSAARTPLDNNGSYRLTTPANRKHLEPPAASSVVSPFFGQQSQRQPEVARPEARERFSYAVPPAATRASGVDRYQRSGAMPPPASTFQRLDRSMQTRDAPFLQSGEASFHDNNDRSMASTYSKGSQRMPLVANSRPPRPAGSQGRVSLPTVPRSSQRNVGRDVGTTEAGAVDSRSIFSGAGPTRRSVRR